MHLPRNEFEVLPTTLTATAEEGQTLCQGEIDAEMKKREQLMLANYLFLRNLPAVKVIGKVVQAPAPSAPRSRKQQQLHLLHLLPRSRRPRRLHPPRN